MRWRAQKVIGTPLENILNPDCTFRSNSPFGISNREELFTSLQKASEFFSEPQVVVFDAKKGDGDTLNLRCQLSCWYPLPWRPRIIIPLEVSLSIGGSNALSISHIEEKWDLSAPKIFLEQMLPRWWDVWHVFVSPSPEYPPINVNVAPTSDRVAFTELPETLVAEVMWEGAAKYPGPPVLSAPSFSLFGSLRTTKRNRETFSTVLPIEVQSSRFKDPATGEDMKRTVWVYHVPTHLQSVVLNSEAYLQCSANSAISESCSPAVPILSEGRDYKGDNEEQDELEYQVGFDNLSLLKSVSAGITRGNLTVDDQVMEEYERLQTKSYRYRMLPKRLVAEVALKGEVDGSRIKTALELIKTVLAGKSGEVRGQQHRQTRVGRFSSEAAQTSSSMFGLQLWNTKVCFNKEAQPAMAIYEMQYDRRITKVFVEIEPSTA
jgi:hypothetical protein